MGSQNSLTTKPRQKFSEERNTYTMLVLSLFLLFIAGSLSSPPPVPDFEDDSKEVEFRVSDDDSNGSFLLRPQTNNTEHKRFSLKRKYVCPGGVIRGTNCGGCGGIAIDATYSVPDNAHQTGAVIIAKMTQNMAPFLFCRLASLTKIDIFTKTETMTVFPEFAGQANPAGCGSSCSGICQNSCTLDGRKYYTLAGTGGQRTAILDDNILCNSADPYRGTYNVLVHEYGHTVKYYGLSQSQLSQLQAAYNRAKQYSLWADYYPMSTIEEYWATATAVFFNADHHVYKGTGNHINACSGNHFCSSEAEARNHLYRIDPNLYNILAAVYVSGQSTRYVNIGRCARLQ